jgi:hypothetical protein
MIFHGMCQPISLTNRVAGGNSLQSSVISVVLMPTCALFSAQTGPINMQYVCVQECIIRMVFHTVFCLVSRIQLNVFYFCVAND